MGRRALLLVNDQARHGGRASAEAGRLLNAAGLEVAIAPCGTGKGLGDLIRRHVGRVDLVVIGGGDGTLHAAADALVETGLPLGILPLGTANDLARTLRLPSALDAACQVVASGRTTRVDLGWVNGKHFFNAAGVGLSVKIAKRLTAGSKGRWGVFAYLATALRALWYARPFTAEVRCDGTVRRARTVQITVGNGRHFGGGLTVAEDASIADGLLDVYSLEVDHWWRLLPLLPAMRIGTVGSWPRVHASRGREVEVLTRRPRQVNADGEAAAATPARFRVVPGAVSVFVPTPAGGGTQPPHP